MKICKIILPFLFSVVLAQNTEVDNRAVEYFNDELSFIENIQLPIDEISNQEYVKTIRNSNEDVIELSWYSESDSLLRKRKYNYDEHGNLSMISYLNKGNLLSELWFNDIDKSYDYFQYIFGFGFSPMEPNRLTEVLYNFRLLPKKYIFYTQSNKIIGVINIDYENENVVETWFIGNHKKEIRKIDYRLNNLQ